VYITLLHNDCTLPISAGLRVLKILDFSILLSEWEQLAWTRTSRRLPSEAVVCASYQPHAYKTAINTSNVWSTQCCDCYYSANLFKKPVFIFNLIHTNYLVVAWWCLPVWYNPIAFPSETQLWPQTLKSVIPHSSKLLILQLLPVYL
jgi:hypothetical protein